MEVPWARPGSSFTLLFEMLVLHLSREMSVAGVAEVTSEHANRIWRILNHYAEEARLAVDLSVFRKLGIDEFLLRKGHVYMRLFSDLEAARAYYIKLALAQFREMDDPTEAVAYLKQWYFWATHSRLSPVIKAAMKKAYGFKHVGCLRTIFYLGAGKLSLTYPY